MSYGTHAKGSGLSTPRGVMIYRLRATALDKSLSLNSLKNMHPWASKKTQQVKLFSCAP